MKKLHSSRAVKNKAIFESRDKELLEWRDWLARSEWEWSVDLGTEEGDYTAVTICETVSRERDVQKDKLINTIVDMLCLPKYEAGQKLWIGSDGRLWADKPIESMGHIVVVAETPKASEDSVLIRIRTAVGPVSSGEFRIKQTLINPSRKKPPEPYVDEP